MQDICEPPRTGFNQEKTVSIWCKGGRCKLTVSDYLAFVDKLQPNVFEALCDSVTSHSGLKRKRMRKSVERTIKFLDDTLACGSKVLINSTLCVCACVLSVVCRL